MKYIAAYLLAKAGGNDKPTAQQVADILKAAEVKFEQSQLEEVCQKMNEKSLEELIEKGKSDIAKVAGGAPATQTSNTPAPQQQVVQKKEEEAAAAAPLDLGDMFGDW